MLQLPCEPKRVLRLCGAQLTSEFMKELLQFSLLGDFYHQYAYLPDFAIAVSDWEVNVQTPVARFAFGRQHDVLNLKVRRLAKGQYSMVEGLRFSFAELSKDLAHAKTQVRFGRHAIDPG